MRLSARKRLDFFLDPQAREEILLNVNSEEIVLNSAIPKNIKIDCGGPKSNR